MPKKKPKFDTREREAVDAKVICNEKDRLEINIYWYVWIKKNWRTNMRWLSLPSPNYIERHKRMMKCLWNIDYKFSSFPCSLQICILYWNKRRTDLDNRLSSIMDLLTDLWIIEDDNHDIIPEISMISLWYAKNCPAMKIILSKSKLSLLNDETDYKWKDLTKVL